MKRLSAIILALIFCCSFAAAETSLTTAGGVTLFAEELPYYTENESAPVVYYTSEISPESLMRIYAALDWHPEGKIGVKAIDRTRRTVSFKPPRDIPADSCEVDLPVGDETLTLGWRRENGRIETVAVLPKGWSMR